MWQQVKRARPAGCKPRAHHNGVLLALTRLQAGVSAVHQVQAPAIRAECVVGGLLYA
jgi:hypothetical protein